MDPGGAISWTSGFSLTFNAAGSIFIKDFISGSALILNTGINGETDINVALGGISDPLGSLTTDANGTTHINGGSIETSGAQTYHDAVTLGAATNLTGTAITFDLNRGQQWLRPDGDQFGRGAVQRRDLGYRRVHAGRQRRHDARGDKPLFGRDHDQRQVRCWSMARSPVRRPL